MARGSEPYLPPKLEGHEIAAIKALHTGEAEDHQQKMALNVIINKLAGTYDLSFRPDGDRETCFAEGRRFVGLELVKYVNMILKGNTEHG